MTEIIYIILITSTALLMGNEFSIACFIHPSLTRAGHERFIPAIQVFAKLFGKIMPFWMAGTLIFHLVLALSVWSSHHAASLFTLYAAAIWIFIVLLSVIFPVPINNRVGQWNPSELPANWQAERKLWDLYNTIRVGFIGFAFFLLLVAYKNVD
jgi:hypothetical protein